MNSFYLTEQITSTDDYCKSLEYLIPNSTVKTKEKSDMFNSVGDGILSKGFYLGQNLTKEIAKIEVHNCNSCMLSIPLHGYYSTKISQKNFKTNSPLSGSIILPTDLVQYSTNLDRVEDIMILIGYDQLTPILEKNYHIQGVKKNCIEIDRRNKKVQVIYELIINNLQILRLYPHLRESIHFKSSIKEVAKLLIAELIADSLNIDFKLGSSPDSQIVKKAEELMDSNPEKYFSIQQIADKTLTSPRNLQLSFKKHRGYTPMQFLKERKLQRARMLLLDYESNNSIKNVAYESGFLNMSTFSKYYQQMFGELPSETLLNATQVYSID